MKNIFKSLLAVGVLFTTIGCDKDQTVTKFNPGNEDSQAAYFAQKSFSQEFDAASTGEQKLLVDVYRQNNAGDATVGIDQVVPDDSYEFFSIPESVTFKDGEYKTSLEVTILGIENFGKGKNYTAQISIGDHHDFVDVPKLDKKAAAMATRSISSPKYTSITISTTLTLDWQPVYVLKDYSKLLDPDLGEADYKLGEDGNPIAQTTSWIDFWGMESNTEGLAVQRAAGTNVFRVVNCGDGGVNIIFTVDSDPGHKVTVEGQSYFRCVLTPQDAGVDYEGTDDIFISDFPSYRNDMTYDDQPCYWDGGSEFYFTLYWHVPALGGGFNNDGGQLTDAFIFDTGEVADPQPEVAVSYLGASSTETGIKNHTLKFAPNSDAASYYATVLKVDPKLAETCAQITSEALQAQGIEPGTNDWYQYYDEVYADVFKEVNGEFIESLDKIREQIENGTYKGDIPVIKYTAASEEAWNLGSEAGTFTAVAFSESKDGKVKGTDYTIFIYNPEADADKVAYSLDCLPYADISQGYFTDNSLYFGCQAANGDLTAVKYALLTKAAFAEAGLEGKSDAELIAYVDANGKALNADALQEVNNTELLGGYITYLAATPATEYKLISCISNPDATKVEVTDAATEAKPAYGELKCATTLMSTGNYYKHTHVIAQFSGSHLISGKYMIAAATNKTIAAYFTIGADGSVSKNDGVTDEMVISLIEGNGNAFSTGNGQALQSINSGKGFTAALKGTPESTFIVLASANYDSETASWTAAVQTTDFAPSVAFTQTVQVNGKNIEFNWSAAPTAGIFVVEKVVYALVPKAALSNAGVDMAKLSDEMLNDFDARRAEEGSDKAAIDAQEQNAGKVLDVLAANAKTFQGDAAAMINNEGGVNKQFSNVAAGEYALIALANDAYNTKLTVGLAKIQ